MTPEQAKQRAEAARQLLENKLLTETLDAIERDIFQQWEDIPARDVEGRELCWRYYKTARKFRAILQSTMESGKLASFNEKQGVMSQIRSTVQSLRRKP
mgnify:CR=1 FL=1